jgi:hypothetical protein
MCTASPASLLGATGQLAQVLSDQRVARPRAGPGDAGQRDAARKHTGAFRLQQVVKDTDEEIAVEPVVAVKDCVDEGLFHHPLGVHMLGSVAKLEAVFSLHPVDR